MFNIIINNDNVCEMILLILMKKCIINDINIINVYYY